MVQKDCNNYLILMSQELLGPHYFDFPYHLLCLPVSAPLLIQFYFNCQQLLIDSG